ncbi:MAG: gliding motility-associated C-terminal domain-containing protein [Paludibacteraceae bacterium]|nr:gliding motility-associated C-terminal domain-containing protein [Paludibacteraceae bacterium]
MESGFFNNVKYDKYSSQWLEYRFALEGKAFTEWKSFSESDMATVANFDSIYGKKYQFELRIKDCPSYPVCLAEIQMPDKDTIPEQPCTEAISPSVMLIPIPGTGGADFCACDGGTKNPIEYDKWQVKTNFTICEPYTLPVTYKWTNLEYPQYSYSNTGINASQWSYESIQYTLAEEHYGNQIHFELTDASGKVYLDTILLIPPKPQLPQPTPPIPLKWTMSNSISNSVACSGVPLGTVFLNVNCANIPDSAEVEFSQTPNGYNFTAKYNLATREWLFNPSSFTDFTITQSTYDPSLCKSSIGLVFNELLRYGSYKYIIKWRTNSGKDTTTTVQQTIANNFGRYMVSEELSFTTKKTCQGTIYYPKAQVLSWIYGDEENKKAVPTKFRVISGNVTGYEINGGLSTVGFCNSDSLLITKPGRYIVQAFYNPYGANAPNATLAACTVSLDTINYVIQTLSFQDYYGYLCADTHSSTIRGSVTVIAKEGSGVPPYRYDLYSGSNAEGQLIGSNTTGVFNDITVTSANFYVRVEDQCLSSFGVAIPLSPVITTDAVFGDRSVCKGSVAHLQGKMIGTTNQVSYLWTGSNGFSSTNRQIVTPPIVVPSTFSLEISGLGCRIFDSITVEPVDKINVYYEDLLCQGSNYDGGEEYLHPITTAHLATGIYNFSAGPFPASNGGCDSIVNLKLNIIEENTVFEDTMVICDSQFPFLWQDTLFTEGTPSGRYFMPKQKNNCAYRQALRLTVKHPTDTIIEKIICQGERVVFNNKTYTEAGTYSEHFSTGTTCDSLVTMHLLVVFPSQSTVIDSIFKGESYTYNGFNLPEQTILGIKYETLFLKNYLGCDSIVNLQLKVQPFSLRIPELFSPNGDNKNEFFEIENIERYPNNKVLIFNRWGNKVWEKGPYLNDWDGTNQFGLSVGGNILPIGTYFYIIDLGDGSDAIKGYIYLSR